MEARMCVLKTSSTKSFHALSAGRVSRDHPKDTLISLTRSAFSPIIRLWCRWRVKQERDLTFSSLQAGVALYTRSDLISKLCE